MIPVDPWRFVDADDEMVADLLAATVEVIFELGGAVHPQARFVARGGQIHVECTQSDGIALIVVPSECFIRIADVDWAEDGDRLSWQPGTGELTDVETELLIVQTALHNQCAKLPWLARTHPVLADDLTADVVDAVRAFRPSFRREQPSPAELFWSNRCFRLPAHGSPAPQPVVIPLIDLLDHRVGGATPSLTSRAFTVSGSSAAGSADCRLDYGHERDAIGMAVVYGFADESAALAHSAPLSVDVAGVGRVRVLARGRTRAGTLVPPVVHHREAESLVSHLTYRPGGASTLAEQVRAAGHWSDRQSRAVVDAVAAANAGLLLNLQERAAGSASDAALVLARAAAHQARVLAQSVSSRSTSA